MPTSELTPVERAAQQVEAVKAQIERMTKLHPYEGKGKALKALRRELAQAEQDLAGAQKKVAAPKGAAK